MKNQERTPLSETYVPYIDTVGLTVGQKSQIWWELTNSPLPWLSRWVVFRALRQPRRKI